VEGSYSSMHAQYGDNCLLCSKIYMWIDHFKKGRTSVCNEERSGRLSMSRTENNIQAIERMVQKNRQITVDNIARLPYVWYSERSSKRKKIFI
jgi:hypothetical protein